MNRRRAVQAAGRSTREPTSARVHDLRRETYSDRVVDCDERRRAVDRYREEYHDAHARTVTASVSAFRPDAAVRERRAFRSDARVRIRIVRAAPAPVMDGFDVRGMRSGRVYDVDARTGRYLILAGYAISADDETR